VVDTRQEEEEDQVTTKITSSLDNSSSNDSSSGGGGAKSQLFNPPFVHALSFTDDGRYLAAGLGDSTVVVYDYAQGRRVGVVEGGHNSSVAHLHFSDIGGLVTVGNDMKLCWWGVEEATKTSFAASLKGRRGLRGKPNWSLSSGGRVMVADTTSEISVFITRA